MSLDVRPFALAALASLPLSSPLAASLSTVPNASFDCGGAQPVSWPSLVGLQPTYSFGYGGSFGSATAMPCVDNSSAFAPLTVTARKSGEGQKDFLKITMKEVFVSSFQQGPNPLLASIDTAIKFTARSVFHKFDDMGRELYDTFFDLQHKLYDINDTDFQDPLASGYLGFKWRTVGAFVGEYSAGFDIKTQSLVLNFELQQFDALMSLAAAPQSGVAAPGTLLLLGAGLAGAGLSRRRARGW